MLGTPDEDVVFDDLKIRNKLILLLAGPLIITLLLSALGARDRRESASESNKVKSLVSVAKLNSQVVAALQQEVLYSATYVASERDAWSEDLESARKGTDEALAGTLPALEGIGGGSDVESAAGLAVGAVDKLGFYRRTVDQGFTSAQLDQLIVNFTQIQETFLAVNTNIATALTDPQVASDLRSANALASYKMSVATQAALFSSAAEVGEFYPSAHDIFIGASDTEQQQYVLFRTISSSQLKGAVRDARSSEAGTAYSIERDKAIEAEPDAAIEVDPKAVTVSGSTLLTDLHKVEISHFDALIAAASDSASSASRAASLFLIVALVAIAGAIGAALLLGRRITRPLQHVTEAADYLSAEQMPKLIESLKSPTEDVSFRIGSMKPIEISSDDEIGRLARSFNEVQRVAGEVAAEQAQLLRKGIGEMFVNLARRNQALLDRQIEFIDELERGEEDPDQLDNLYKLDHLATRMRRNAESLLVLAGAEPPRRRGRPAPLANVVRAALAEVEDFGRIDLLSFDEVLVASNSAADLAHLLSELMENATNFSPPETHVEVVGHRTKADGYVISISDHGIGMSADQLADANEALARPPLVGLAMSRSLGFIVVGRLAARHGITVRMMPSAAGGVTAVVSLPPALVMDTPGSGASPSATFEPPARLKPVFEPTPEEPTSGGIEIPEPVSVPAPAHSNSTPPPVTWGPPRTEPEPVVAEEPTPEPEQPAAARPSVPAALSFEAPPEKPAAPPRTSTGPRPFFLEDAEPPRAFGEAAPEQPQPDPEPVAAPAAPKLFGTPVPPKESTTEAEQSEESAAGQDSAPGHLDGRPPLAPRRPAAPKTTPPPSIVVPPIPGRSPEPDAGVAEPEPVAPATPAEQPAPALGSVTTSSGLAKRVPRSAGGVRAIPGSEAPRGVSGSRRSPEEIRKMLAQHSAGRQRARNEEPVSAGVPEDREPNE